MKGNLLLVDDDENVLGMLDFFLTNEGFNVAIAENGKDALEKYNADFHELIIKDLDMPVMDGIEFLKRIKKRDPNCIGIILTGVGCMETSIACLRDGLAYDYLLKPLENLDLLTDSCSKALEKRDLETQKRNLTDSLKKSNAELFNTLEQLKKTQNELLESNRISALIEMARAVAHEVNNPLCAVTIKIALMLEKMKENHPEYQTLREVIRLLERIAGVTKNIKNLRTYKTRPHFPGDRIIDIQAAAEDDL